MILSVPSLSLPPITEIRMAPFFFSEPSPRGFLISF